MSALSIVLDRLMAFARPNRNGQQIVIAGGTAGTYTVQGIDATAIVVAIKQGDNTWSVGHTGAATEAATVTTALNP